MPASRAPRVNAAHAIQIHVGKDFMIGSSTWDDCAVDDGHRDRGERARRRAGQDRAGGRVEFAAMAGAGDAAGLDARDQAALVRADRREAPNLGAGPARDDKLEVGEHDATGFRDVDELGERRGGCATRRSGCATRRRGGGGGAAGGGRGKHRGWPSRCWPGEPEGCEPGDAGDRGDAGAGQHGAT